MAQIGQRFAELGHARRLDAEAHGDALRRAEEIDQDGITKLAAGRIDRPLEQDGGTAGGEHAPVNLGHLVHERDRLGDTHQHAGRIELGHELAQVGTSHLAVPVFRYRPWRRRICLCANANRLAGPDATVGRFKDVPMLPPILRLLATPLPLPLVQGMAQASLTHILREHPGLFDRLGTFAARPIAISPTDAPFDFTLVLARRSVRVTRRGATPPAYATRICGPIVLLLALAEGRLDGDAEFFGRHISIEGDMETALALRNAAESIPLDFVRDLAPPWRWAQRPGQAVLGAVRRSLLEREGVPCN